MYSTTTTTTSTSATRRTPRSTGLPAYFLGRPAAMYRRRYRSVGINSVAER